MRSDFEPYRVKGATGNGMAVRMLSVGLAFPFGKAPMVAATPCAARMSRAKLITCL